MNETERTDKRRGYKALFVLIVLPLLLFGTWQYDRMVFGLVLIVLLGVAVWAWLRHRGVGRPLGAAPRPARQTQSLFEQYQETIATFRSRVHLSGSFEVDNLVRDCITTIAQQTGRTAVAPHGEYLYKWERRTDIPDEYRKLAEELKADFTNRQDEIRKIKNEQTDLRAQQKLLTNWDLVQKFLEITERKVSILDDYGDEHWGALPDEIFKLLKKINERDGESIRWEHIKRPKGRSSPTTINWGLYGLFLPEEYRLVAEKLQQLFREHHEKLRSHRPQDDAIKDLSGVEFESYLAKLLRAAGYDVQGTPTTGDQGADLIAKKDGRKIVIQAKRYEGTVGNKAVQEVSSAVSFYGCTEGWVVTNSTFTPSAVALAQKTNVKLIDGTKLRDGTFL